MKHTYSILFWLSKAKATAAGVPIYCRITVNGKRKEISTNRRIHPDEWNGEQERVKGRGQTAQILNEFLDSLLKLNFPFIASLPQ